MGGCYSGSYGYSGCSSRDYSRSVRQNFQEFKSNGDISKLINAQRYFLEDNNSGFIARFAEFSGISNIENIPKEFKEFEYEVKFDIHLEKGNGKEPGIKDYLDVFDFPPSKSARFLKDPVNAVSEGTNNFYGSGLEEKLVVIEKGGGVYLKEKSSIIPVNQGIMFEEIIIKRTEKRYKSSIENVLEKVQDIYSDKNARYFGRIRKEKGDDFILDTNDGRIYSFTITRSHLTKSGEEKESDIQRQLEIEYAGYMPSFPGFEKDSEKQIVQGMVDLARFTWALYNDAPIKNKWRMKLFITNERKYDFVSGQKKKKQEKILIPQIFQDNSGLKKISYAK